MGTTTERKDDMATDIVTGVARASYVHLDKPYAPAPRPGESPQTPKYSIMLMIPKTDTKTYEKLVEVEKKTIAADDKIFKGRVPSKYNSIIQDGDGENQNGELHTEKNPERAGHWLVSVRSNTPPGVVDAQRNRIPAETVYSGSYVRAALSCFTYDYNGKKGVSFGLNNVQFIKDGEAFGGRASDPEDDFDDFDDPDI